MKQLLICIALFLAFGYTSAQEHAGRITLNLSGYAGFTPVLKIGPDTYKIPIDSLTGMGNLELSLNRASYAILETGKSSSGAVFLEPGKTLTISTPANGMHKSPGFEGESAPENEFIHRKGAYVVLAQAEILNASVDELFFRIDSVATLNREKLAAERLSPVFTRLESERINIDGYQRYALRGMVRDTAAYIGELRKRMPDREELLVIDDYRKYMEGAIKKIVSLENGGRIFEGKERVEKMSDAILRCVGDREVRACLLEMTILPFLSQSGPAGNGDLVALYTEYAGDPARLAKLEKICAVFSNVAVGMPCPEFCFEDVNGKVVCLKEFRGRFVLIDLWATWCGPCIAEFPYLKALEKRYEGYDLCFVGISVDRNSDIGPWKQMVADKELDGIQLHLGENWDWLKNFMPSSITIPRFILLDKEGKIIDAAFCRPSDARAKKVLDELTGYSM